MCPAHSDPTPPSSERIVDLARAIEACRQVEATFVGDAYEGIKDDLRADGVRACIVALENLPMSATPSNNAALIRNIEALLALDSDGALVPHGIGGLARSLLTKAVTALTAAGLSVGAEQGPTQIAMGHGLVDVGGIFPADGRVGLLLHPRKDFIPVGAPGTLGNKGQPKVYQPVDGDVVIWLDGPELGQTIINKLLEIAAERPLPPPPAQEAQGDG